MLSLLENPHCCGLNTWGVSDKEKGVKVDVETAMVGEKPAVERLVYHVNSFGG